MQTMETRWIKSSSRLLLKIFEIVSVLYVKYRTTNRLFSHQIIATIESAFNSDV